MTIVVVVVTGSQSSAAEEAVLRESKRQTVRAVNTVDSAANVAGPNRDSGPQRSTTQRRRGANCPQWGQFAALQQELWRSRSRQDSRGAVLWSRPV